MSDKDFLLNEEDLPKGKDPFAVRDLKKATYKQLKEMMVVVDYVFCSLLQSSRLTCLDP